MDTSQRRDKSDEKIYSKIKLRQSSNDSTSGQRRAYHAPVVQKEQPTVPNLSTFINYGRNMLERMNSKERELVREPRSQNPIAKVKEQEPVIKANTEPDEHMESELMSL
jgi:hypothetical protein